ncbi:MAG: hypothetical protein EBT79_14990 [Actinobacteria bacterium]|nr:hypothetical protein [Actinomycetota bacterium]NBR68551.1 hypothetical protein [Actinomycetota bacterium]NDD98121.1 hypothetical protein [Actinomycetota bacterium]NDE81856.1 hypothetical protein [Actinomycetota bacterium]
MVTVGVGVRVGVFDGVGDGIHTLPHIPTFGDTIPTPPETQFISPKAIHSVSITESDRTAKLVIISPLQFK